jgi:hypothetical protein
MYSPHVDAIEEQVLSTIGRAALRMTNRVGVVEGRGIATAPESV